MNAYALCERFGWTLDYVRSLDSIERAQIQGYMKGKSDVDRFRASKRNH